ncbi:inverse autotransporter beta domain-containing protein [Parvibaculaceae bacterium PLY_AMNH_Bact1]|nr:inverse autotransporter beta domain-containing protein [Parvibaculaceae bacterium PLY_AMNH_Bact1]
MLTGLARHVALWAIFAVCFGVLTGPAFADAGLGAGAEPNWEPWVEAGGTLSNRNDRVEAVGWVPIVQDDDQLLFVEARGKLFEGGSEEGNFALGYREMRPNGWNLGVWGGYDIRTSENGNTFHQIAGGVEALSKDWDVRLNGYYPLEDQKSIGTSSTTSTSSIVSTGPALSLVGSQLFFARGGATTTTVTTTSAGFDLAAWGVDGEAGRRAPLEEWFDWVQPVEEGVDLFDHEARIFLGGFYFDNSLFPEAIWGPRLRGEWRLNDVFDSLPGSRLTFEVEAQHDDVRKEQIEFGVRLRIPLGSPNRSHKALAAQSARMMEALERDTDIVTRSRAGSTVTSVTSVDLPTTLEPVKDPNTNVDLDQVVFLDTPGTAQVQVTAAGGNSLIVLQGGNGTFGQTILQADQSIVGGAQGILVEGRASGVQDTYVAPGAAATVHVLAEADAVRVANNSHVTGLTISSNGLQATDGINIPNATTNVYIDNTSLQNLGGRGLEIGNNVQFTFTNNSLSDQGVFSAVEMGSGANAVITNNTWRNITRTTIEVRPNSTLTYTGNNHQGTSATGGGSVFLFNGGAGASNIVDGSSNLNTLTNAPTVCQTNGAASFTGTIDFGGTALTDNVLPCN